MKKTQEQLTSEINAYLTKTSQHLFSVDNKLITFVPFKDGKATGEWEIFANGFAGTENGAKVINTGKAKARPCGLALGPDGSIYVSDDTKGAIFKISYSK
jgi:glucose/arabinose dehydrogenase